MSNKHNREIAPDVFLNKKYYLKHNPFETSACTDPHEYVERKDELSLFERSLNLIKISKCTGKRIIGRKGIGKTSLVNMYFEIAHKHMLKTIYVAPVPNSGQKFMQNLLSAAINAETDENKRNSLGKRYGEFVRRKTSYPDDIFKKFTEVIDELQPKPVIVAIDETDNLPKISQIAPLFNNYIFDHANDVMFILCVLPGTHEKITKKMGAFIDRFPEIIYLPSFSNNELLKLLEKKLGVAQIKQTQTIKSNYWPFTKKAVEKLLEHAGGVPRYLIDVARAAVNTGVESQTPRINEEIVDKAAVRAKRGNLVSIWHSLNSFEKQILNVIVSFDEKNMKNIRLEEIVDVVKKEKSWVWRSINELVERGLVEKQGEAKKDVTYRLIADPKLISILDKNEEMK